jgi:hypothetical protein
MIRFKRTINTIYIKMRRVFSLLVVSPLRFVITCWAYIFTKASVRQVYLNLGSQLLQIGANIKVGDPQHVPVGKNPNGTIKYQLMYVKNIYYNFGENKVTCTYNMKVREKKTRSEKQLTKKVIDFEAG